MAEIVNLRMARKRKARAAEEKTAEENRVRFGRTSARRRAEETARKAEATALDAHRRELPDRNGDA